MYRSAAGHGKLLYMGYPVTAYLQPGAIRAFFWNCALDGAVEDAFGKMTGNQKTQAEGKVPHGILTIESRP